MEAGKKRAVKITALALIIVILAVGAVLSGMAIAQAVKVKEAEEYAVEYAGERLNVIFMIGDGMGFDHVAAAEAKYGKLFSTTTRTSRERRPLFRITFSDPRIRRRQPPRLPRGARRTTVRWDSAAAGSSRL